MTLPEPLQQYEAQARLFVEDTSRWFQNNLKIIDRKNDLIPLIVNDQQRQTLFWVGMQLAAGVPVRIIILKARRLGMSTVITALGFYFAIVRKNYPAFACAHDADGTDTLRGMCKTFQEELPEGIARESKYDSLKGLVCAPPHRSSYKFHTAGRKDKSGLGRTKEITYLHISEKAFIANFKVVAAGLKATVPRKNPLSCIFEESTANGENDSGQFYESWGAAVKHRQANQDNVSGYIPLFFSWLEFPEYREVVPDGYDWGEFDEYEYRLKDLGADEEQLYYRRRVIAEDYNGDPSIFAQEFPATPEEAFQATGSPAIPHEIVAFHEKHVRPPKRIVLYREEQTIRALEAPPGVMHYWEVWNEPNPECDYTVAGDVAEGKLSDPADEKSDRDYSAGAVLNRRYFQIDAIWVGRIPADAWGQELRKCAEWYNEAWASPEANAVGQASLVAFKDYDRVYQRRPSEPVGGEERELPEIGFKTVGGLGGNRKYMIDMYIAACGGNEEVRVRAGFADRLRVFSSKVVEQEKTFIKNKKGIREHQSGKHDDILFAMFIALQLHICCERTLHVTEYKYGQPRKLDSRWAGGVAGPEDDEEEVTVENLRTT